MRKLGWIASIAALVLLGIACSTFAQGKKGTQTAPAAGKAAAVIEAKSGSTLAGTAEFTMHEGQMMITVSVKGAPPGAHAVHVHEKGDCSAPDASSAGGHFNPGGHQHGAPEAAEHHAGDLGNMTVGADGTGSLMIHSSDLSLSGANSVVGHAIIVHEKTDDFVTQPTGNAGGRIGCGVIR
jgi:superoxide dismutase, Cu-Zn family